MHREVRTVELIAVLRLLRADVPKKRIAAHGIGTRWSTGDSLIPTAVHCVWAAGPNGLDSQDGFRARSARAQNQGITGGRGSDSSEAHSFCKPTASRDEAVDARAGVSGTCLASTDRADPTANEGADTPVDLLRRPPQAFKLLAGHPHMQLKTTALRCRLFGREVPGLVGVYCHTLIHAADGRGHHRPIAGRLRVDRCREICWLHRYVPMFNGTAPCRRRGGSLMTRQGSRARATGSPSVRVEECSEIHARSLECWPDANRYRHDRNK